MFHNLRRLKAPDWVRILSVCVVFFVFLYFKEDLKAFHKLNPFLPVAETFLGFMFISIFLNRVSERSIEETVSKKLDIYMGIKESGLEAVHLSFKMIDYADLIERADKHIDLISTYSHSWIKQNIEKLQAFAQNKKAEINIVLTKPESDYASSAEKKYIKAEQLNRPIKDRVEEAIDFISEYFGKSSAKVCIYLTDVPLAYSYFRFDGRAVSIPYRHSAGRLDNVPAFLFSTEQSKEGVFQFLTGDFDQLLENHVEKRWSNEGN